jgi:hypothetical protein
VNIKQGGKLVPAKKCQRCRGKGFGFARCSYGCLSSLGRKDPGWCKHSCGACNETGLVKR